MLGDMSEAQFAGVLGRVHAVGPELAPKIAREFYSGSFEIPIILKGPRLKEPTYQIMIWAVRRAEEMREAA